jgi:putative glycosyltransferase (TIGR04372 family)
VVLGKSHANDYLFRNYLSEKSLTLSLDKTSTELFEFINELGMEKVGKLEIERQSVTLLHAEGCLNWKWFVEQNKECFLTLKDRDYEIGWQYLSSKGLTPDDWFVALHTRWSGEGLEQERNVEIDSYREMVEWIIGQGGFVFKVGLPDLQVMNFEHPQYIDYSNSSEQNEVLDIFLSASCRLFVATSSGLSHLAMSFGAPVLHTNITNLGVYPFYPKSKYIPKLKLGFNNVDRAFSYDLQGGFYDTDHVEKKTRSYTVRDNKSGEILDACIEMFMFEKSNYKKIEDSTHYYFKTISQRNGYPTTPIAKSFYDKHNSYFSK